MMAIHEMIVKAWEDAVEEALDVVSEDVTSETLEAVAGMNIKSGVKAGAAGTERVVWD
ncbi:MAG: hypothetical protein HC884_18440 [Chloroflexaceae bacterium]|nr:hypothetical protein [Chloroflexaceae bacterium]